MVKENELSVSIIISKNYSEIIKTKMQRTPQKR